MLMSSMREKTRFVLFLALLAFVGLIFFDWGMQKSGGGSGGPNPAVAKVNGQKIPWESYRLVRQQTLANFEARTGRTAESADLDAIENEVWVRLIREAVVSEQIDKYDISISDAEILETLRTNPPAAIRASFQNDAGEFDVAAYSQALADPGMATQWAAVEDFLRSTMPPDKIQNYVAMAARVTSNELHERFLAENEKVTVRYVASVPARVDYDATGAEGALQAYYESHAENYVAGDRATLEYVRVSKEPAAEDSTAAFEDLSSLRDEIRSGSDFAELARTWSDDTSAERGGDLGFIAKGDMVPEFEQTAWATPTGQVSDVFTTPFGYHILKVEERKREDGQEKLRVRHILLRVEASSHTVRQAAERLDDFLDAVADGESFRKAAETTGLALETTDPFEAGGAIPGIGLLGGADRFAFSNPVGAATTDPLEDRTALYALRVAAKLPAGRLAFEEVRERVASDLETEQRRVLARAAMEAAIDAGNGSLDGIANALDTEVVESTAFSRESFVPGIGRRNAFVSAAFGLTDGQTSGLVETDRGFYVMEFVSRQAADEAQFAEQRDRIRQQLVGEKRQTLVTSWLEELIVPAEVVDYRAGGKGVPWKVDPELLYYGHRASSGGGA